MNTGEYIKNKRIEKKMTLEELGEAVGVGKSTVRKWENGIIKNIRRDKIALLAKALDISPLTLLDVPDEIVYKKSDLPYRYIPLYKNICCGNGGFSDDNILEYVPVPSDGLYECKEYFCQYAEGDSMKEKIEDGDLLVFEKNSTPELNTICCFCTEENTSMCKMFVKSGSVYMLKPLNSAYDSIVVDSDTFRCIGKLKKIIRSV